MIYKLDKWWLSTITYKLDKGKYLLKYTSQKKADTYQDVHVKMYYIQKAKRNNFKITGLQSKTLLGACNLHEHDIT